MTPAALLLVAAGLLAAGGCRGFARAGEEAPPPPRLPAAEPFIAFERDFQGFRRWPSIALPEREAQGLTHLDGRRTEFVNARPPAGASTFPVGTILVKEIDTGKRGHHQLFAMVKRGGGYNAQGARGWEWFELREREDGSVGVNWRGLNAPSGEGYGGDPAGGCNGCHEIAADNDFVRASALRLGGESTRPGR